VSTAFNLTALSPMSPSENETAVKLAFIQSFFDLAYSLYYSVLPTGSTGRLHFHNIRYSALFFMIPYDSFLNYSSNISIIFLHRGFFPSILPFTTSLNKLSPYLQFCQLTLNRMAMPVGITNLHAFLLTLFLVLIKSLYNLF